MARCGQSLMEEIGEGIFPLSLGYSAITGVGSEQLVAQLIPATIIGYLMHDFTQPFWGKAALFKAFAGVDAISIVLDTKDTEEIINIIKAIAPTFGGINLEDISASRCFEIEQHLIDDCQIPIFHDDQHGTAIVVLAAVFNSLKLLQKSLAEVSITRKLLAAGATKVTVVDKFGIINE